MQTISIVSFKGIFVNKETYMLSSTRSFVDQISSFDFLPSHVLVSYDVVSLFTNIPLNETIDIVCNYVYQQHSPPKYSMETF